MYPKRWWISLCWISLMVGNVSWGVAEVTGTLPVVRRTDDRDADLVLILIESSRFEEAIEICQSQFDSQRPDSDAAARWAIRFSQVLVARQMAGASFDAAAIESAQLPVDQLLQSYPNHRRKSFLLAQQQRVRSSAARHSVVMVAVSPASNDLIEQSMAQMVRATTGLQELAEQVGRQETLLNQATERKDFALIGDLIRLQQELQIDIVSMSLMQTELFAANQQDRIGAAAAAQSAAEAALQQLPAGSPARREVDRLRIESLMRGGQWDQAASELERWVESAPKPLPPVVLAMQVRVDLAKQRLPQAKATLSDFYASNPISAPRSIDMDLARLEYLMSAAESDRSIGDWLVTIENRNGLYARRRAEALSLSKLRNSDRTGRMDPALVVAQGEDWLRRGDSQRAGELFAAAAEVESDDKRAIDYATRAAAALVKANQQEKASQTLQRISQMHPEVESASASHLQSAVVLWSSPAVNVADKLKSILRMHLQIWPDGPQAPDARQWLVKILDGQNRPLEAAIAATTIDPVYVTTATMQAAVERWIKLFLSADPESLDALMDDFSQAFEPLADHPIAGPVYRSAAGRLLSRDRLKSVSVDAQVGDSEADRYSDRLLAARQRGSGWKGLLPPPEEIAEVVVWRLMQDGREHPELRQAIAARINDWSVGEESSLSSVQRMLWLGRVPDAKHLADKWIDQSKQAAEDIQAAARLFADDPSREARSVAIQFWDRYASGQPQGSEGWHSAKLQAIDLLAQMGDRQEATKRAKYILLTRPPTQAELLAQYQKWVQRD